MSSGKPVRVAVDVGGTFTDLEIHDARTGGIEAYKTPTTPQDPSIGLIAGIDGAANQFGFAPSDIGLIMHGSTIATNAVLERKLPKGALITTAGFEDVLEIGRHMRKNVYALKVEDRALLIPRQLRFGVRERVRADGTVAVGLDEQGIVALAERLVSLGIEAVAIAFLHAYRCDVNERRAAELVGAIAPHLSITTSAQSSPEIREYERTSTTVLNALLKPVISGYLERLTGRLENAGVAARLYMVQSNGGVALPDEAARMPVNLLLSGPAGGAMAVDRLAREHGIANLVGLDMGGTSSDICIVDDGVVGVTAESEIDGLPIRLPMIEIRTIGAGGGSLARAEANALRVGPQSAGANPGPACYGRGGTRPTVTDANAVLGRIAPSAFMGGGMALDVKLASAAVSAKVAGPLALPPDAAAAGIVDVANTHMAGAIRLGLFEKGADPADFTLAPFGGAAGLHACAVADELDIERIVFPANASTLSARGILMADLRRDLSRSELMLAAPANTDRIAAIVADLGTEAAAMLAQTGLAEERHLITFTGDLRYRGQAYEIATPWPGLTGAHAAVDPAAVQRLVAAFHRLHQQRYAHSAPDEVVELVTLRAVATGRLDRATLTSARAAMPASISTSTSTSTSASASAAPTSRTVCLAGQWQELPVYTRDDALARSAEAKPAIDGPALIEEAYTVLLIAPGWQVRAAHGGDLIATRKEG